MKLSCGYKALEAYDTSKDSESVANAWSNRKKTTVVLSVLIVMVVIGIILWIVLRTKDEVVSSTASGKLISENDEPYEDKVPQDTVSQSNPEKDKGSSKHSWFGFLGGNTNTNSNSNNSIDDSNKSQQKQQVTSTSEAVMEPRGSIQEEVIDTTKIHPEWKMYHNQIIPYHVSSSFGYSVTRLDDYYFMVGSPQDENYGQVFVYYLDQKNKNVELTHQNLFSTVGTIFQHAGKYLSGPMIAAPDFRQTPNPTENTLGAIFHMTNYGKDQELTINRIPILNQKDGYYLCKTGQVMYYNFPYLYVNEELNGVHRRIAVYYFNEQNQLTWEQNIVSSININKFGYSMTVSEDDTCMVVTDPQNDELYVYLRNDIRESWVRVQVMTNVFSEDPLKGSDDATIALSKDGEKLVIASSCDQYVRIYEWKYSRFEMMQEIGKPNETFQGFASDLVMSPFGEQLFIVNGPSQVLYGYQWHDKEARYVFHGTLKSEIQGQAHYMLLKNDILIGVQHTEDEEKLGRIHVWIKSH